MTAADGELATAHPHTLPLVHAPLAVVTSQWRSRLVEHLRDPRFWVVQALVLAVAGGHLGAEIYGDDRIGAAYFMPASLYFFPILYASLNFGREGAIPTAIWGGLLALPNVVLWHRGIQLVGETFQLTLIGFLALVVAIRVDKEVTARRLAEQSEDRRAISELKYRTLFDGAGEPVLVVDDGGTVLESNAAAASLLGRSAERLRGVSIMRLLGIDLGHLRGSPGKAASGPLPDISLVRQDGSEAWFQPVCTLVPGPDGATLVQVLLRDVTERRGFQHYAQEIVGAQEAERQHIAHELHDVSLQAAVHLCRQLDTAAEAATAGDQTALLGVLADARKSAETMADEIRRFSRDLRPFILEDLGLVPALRQLVTEMGERSSLQCQLTVSGRAQRLDPGVELALFRIAQEALHNAERHARATHISLRLALRANGTTLTVADDGRGFAIPDFTALVAGKHLGLLGMRERMRLVGGTCEIRSTPGQGTRIEVAAPAASIHV